jgi:hypothetical protein
VLEPLQKGGEIRLSSLRSFTIENSFPMSDLKIVCRKGNLRKEIAMVNLLLYVVAVILIGVGMRNSLSASFRMCEGPQANPWRNLYQLVSWTMLALAGITILYFVSGMAQSSVGPSPTDPCAICILV